jgi:hypothetical protein
VETKLRRSCPHGPHRQFLQEHKWRRGDTNLALAGVYTIRYSRFTIRYLLVTDDQNHPLRLMAIGLQ